MLKITFKHTIDQMFYWQCTEALEFALCFQNYNVSYEPFLSHQAGKKNNY